MLGDFAERVFEGQCWSDVCFTLFCFGLVLGGGGGALNALIFGASWSTDDVATTLEHGGNVECLCCAPTLSLSHASFTTTFTSLPFHKALHKSFDSPIHNPSPNATASSTTPPHLPAQRGRHESLHNPQPPTNRGPSRPKHHNPPTDPLHNLLQNSARSSDENPPPYPFPFSSAPTSSTSSGTSSFSIAADLQATRASRGRRGGKGGGGRGTWGWGSAGGASGGGCWTSYPSSYWGCNC